ncbi:hypothetical protein L484_008704 [Morus notabilis]|uniref:Uncharacterized protein n=1 Tax=Morus notabilis TaxID=981085 RepID=W9R8T8_9ROSA|nr:hypothetical protein L484_008704 [Morus notabilis]
MPRIATTPLIVTISRHRPGSSSDRLFLTKSHSIPAGIHPTSADTTSSLARPSPTSGSIDFAAEEVATEQPASRRPLSLRMLEIRAISWLPRPPTDQDGCCSLVIDFNACSKSLRRNCPTNGFRVVLIWSSVNHRTVCNVSICCSETVQWTTESIDNASCPNNRYSLFCRPAVVSNGVAHWLAPGVEQISGISAFDPFKGADHPL